MSGGLTPEWEPSSGGSCVAIFLNSGCSEALQSVFVDRLLPGQELFNGQGIPFAGIFQAKQSALNGGNNLCLAPDHPALRIRAGQIGKGKGLAGWADD